MLIIYFTDSTAFIEGWLSTNAHQLWLSSSSGCRQVWGSICSWRLLSQRVNDRGRWAGRQTRSATTKYSQLHFETQLSDRQEDCCVESKKNTDFDFIVMFSNLCNYSQRGNESLNAVKGENTRTFSSAVTFCSVSNWYMGITAFHSIC